MADEPLGRMVIELGLDDSGFGKSLTGARQMVRSSMAEMKSSMAVMGQSGKQFDVLEAKSRGLVKVMEAQRREAIQLKKAYEGSLVDGQATKQTAKLATQYNNATGKLSALNQQYVRNAGLMAKARVETTGFTGGLNRVSKAAVVVGQKGSALGDKMTRGVTAPIAAGLVLATKSAIDFQSQIDSMGPLLTNGGAITAKYRSQLDQLGNSSKKWSKQYGVSTSEINNGMSELIKRGFTTNQVIGSMPSIMDATKASGEDMGTVMQATASIVEQFGLKTNSVSGTMKNTQRVTDSLTYAANATAAGFGDMSDAMSYVGPVASSLGLNVEQTAAAVGELSNQGIEGQKAGTNLRGILTSLVKPTKQNMQGFKSMGISAKELAHDSHDLPQLIDDITKGTEGWKNAERGKALAQAFGRENQAAANALVKAGSSSLRQLTKDTEGAGGATKKVADELNDTKANQIKRFQASLQVLGITIGEKLLPTFTPLIKKATDMVTAFSNMDDSTQQTILKLGLLAAAAGPVLSVGGRLVTGVGRLGTGTVSVISKLAQMRAKSQASKAGLDLMANGAKGASDALGKVNGTAANVNGSVNTAKTGFTLFGKAMTTSAGEAGILGTSLTATGATAVGVGVAVLAGAAYWELYGKQAHESAERAGRWGSDVGQQADTALTKFKGFSSQAGSALTDFETASQTSTKNVAKNFDDMYAEMKRDSDETITQMEKDMKGLPDSVQDDLKEDVKDRKKHNATVLADAKQNYANAEAILKNHGGKMSGLSDTERTALRNYQTQMNDDEIGLLKLGGSAKKNVLAALNGDIKNMTRNQRNTTINDLTSSMQKENKLYGTQKKQIESMYNKGEISAGQYSKALKDLRVTHDSTTDGMAAGILKLDKANGASSSQIKQDLLNVGYSYKEASAIVKQQNEDMSKSASLVVEKTGNMGKRAKAAADAWNGLVFNAKTGKVKTNAQEEVDKAAKSTSKWNQMKLLVKQGKMSSNAAAMVGVAAVQTKRWDGLSLKDKQAMIRSKGGDDLAKLLQDGKQWGKLTMAEKKAIITAKGGSDLLLAVSNAKTWNKLTLKEQKAVLKDNASPAMKQASIGVKEWNNLTPRMKTILAKAKGSEDVAKGVKSIRDWNSLPTSEKKLIANDKGSRGIIKNVTSEYKKYQDLPASAVKNLLAKDQASGKANAARISVGKYGQLKVKSVGLNAKNNTGTAVSGAKRNISSVPKTNGNKNLTATNKTGDGVNSSKGLVGTFVHMNGNKPLSASNKTGTGVTSSKGTVQTFMNVPGSKKLTANNQTGSGVGAAKASLDSVHDKHVTITAMFNAVKSGAAKLWHAAGFKNGTASFTGGPALVNDQEGPVFREAIEVPGHPAFIPRGRNILMEDLPARTKIYPAKLTARMYDVPQYATGVGIPKNADVVQATALTQPEMSIVSGNQSTDYTKLLQTANDTANQQIDMLSGALSNILSAVLGIKPGSGVDYQALMRRMAKDRSIKSL
ncbi:phage tail tape measure protein [Lactiplantibacillus paraxiangfangensis]|uniref:phage tail tape measure protein n=1 Tax=Lactiplantibacillus paraxiangfangensis TaxID=3076224 RepID=UPI0030C6A9EC